MPAAGQALALALAMALGMALALKNPPVHMAHPHPHPHPRPEPIPRLAERSICCRDANAAAANPHNRHRRQRLVFPTRQKLPRLHSFTASTWIKNTPKKYMICCLIHRHSM